MDLEGTNLLVECLYSSLNVLVLVLYSSLILYNDGLTLFKI